MAIMLSLLNGKPGGDRSAPNPEEQNDKNDSGQLRGGQVSRKQKSRDVLKQLGKTHLALPPW